MVCPEITRAQIVQFAGASGDFSPLHTDEPRARQAGYPGVLAHGMMHPVLPGDALTAVVTVVAVREDSDSRHVDFAISTSNQDGVEVVTGHASARID